MSEKKSMINCHTHIFNGKCVSPYIVKGFMPWPLYYLVHTPTLLRINEFFKFKDGKWKEFYEKWIILKYY